MADQQAQKRNMVPVAMKVSVPAIATAVLDNGDVVCLNVAFSEIRKVLGETDDNGNQKYDADFNMLFGMPAKT